MQVWSWRHAIAESPLKPITKLVLYTISNFMNSYGGGCYPSIATIAEQCGLKERSVYNHIDAAVSAGFLIKNKRQLRGSKWAANEYQAAYPEGVTLGSVQEDGVHEDAAHLWDAPGCRAAPACRSGVHEDAGLGCTSVHTNSPMNSPLNSPKESKPKKSEISTELIDQQFECFWKEYLPIKVDKGSKRNARKGSGLKE